MWLSLLGSVPFTTSGWGGAQESQGKVPGQVDIGEGLAKVALEEAKPKQELAYLM